VELGLRENQIASIIQAAGVEGHPARSELWKREFRRMLKAFQMHKGKPPHGSVVTQLCEPLMCYAHGSLFRALSPGHRRDFRMVLAQCGEELLDRLSDTLQPCVALHFAAFQAAFRTIKGDAPPEAMRHLFLRPHPVQRLHELYLQFPVLAHISACLVADWRLNTSEMFRRIARDRSLLARTFLRSRDFGKLIQVRTGLSDPHNGGRTVALLRFEMGTIVYKPRSGEGEHEWLALLRWMNKKGLRPKLRTPKILCRGNYCWMEHIASMNCRSNIEWKRYFQRVGALICATHLVRAIDCHRDNIIAAGENPVLVDAESLWHVEKVGDNEMSPESLLRTGWLPTPAKKSDTKYAITPLNPEGIGAHAPKHGDDLLLAVDHRRELAAGFKGAWQVLLDAPRSRAALRRRLRRIANKPWRRIFRSTGNYAMIRDMSLHPSLMRSGKLRYEFIKSSCQRAGVGRTILLKEGRALFRLDIPHFLRTGARQAVIPSANCLDENLRVLRTNID
jgi:lantibiotic modifying enzyme